MADGATVAQCYHSSLIEECNQNGPVSCVAAVLKVKWVRVRTSRTRVRTIPPGGLPPGGIIWDL